MRKVTAMAALYSLQLPPSWAASFGVPIRRTASYVPFTLVARMAQSNFRFEEFELNVDSCELRRSGVPQKVERIPMELLLLLLQNPGKLVRREAINERLWGDGVFIEAEHGINTAINKLRATLRDDSRDPRFIRTVVGRGYCFIAEVNLIQPVERTTAADALLPPISQKDASFSTGSNGHLGAAHVSTAHVDEGPTVVPQTLEAGRLPPPSDTESAGNVAHGKQWRMWLLTSALLFLAVAGTVFLLLRHRPERPIPANRGPRSIAVLPFRNLAQDSDQDYLVDGMTEQLIAQLGKNSSLRVISYGSVMQYKGVQSSIRDTARQLNVDMIVEGSYLRAGQKVRITAQLLDARDDREVWAQAYEESGAELLTMQDQVTNDIAHRIAFSLGSTFRSTREQTASAQARDAYLRGRYLWNQRTVHGLNESIRYYTEALRADPNYAEAYAGLAESYVLLSIYGDEHPSGSLTKAQSAAESALQIDNNLSQAHTALAAVKTDRDWDWPGAEREYRRALELNPGDPTAHHWYALHLSRLGRWQEAETEIQRALALDPLSLIINTDAAEIAYWSRRPNLAMSRVDAVLTLNPGFAQAHLVKGKVLEQLHRYREAEAEFVVAGRLFGEPKSLLSIRAHALALAGENDKALKIVKDLEAASNQRYVSGVHIAQVYCALHRTDDALKWLDHAYQQHDTGINMLKVEPMFDGCRPDPRFQRLTSELHLGD
jgi:TolB-like protein/DNA-binding winged helix-turn-helix (wHTH) protein/Tfp pilus assembly protein PilF